MLLLRQCEHALAEGGHPLTGFPARDWLLIAAITVCAQLLGHTLFNLVLSSVGPTMVSLVILLLICGAAIFAAPLLLVLVNSVNGDRTYVGSVSNAANHAQEMLQTVIATIFGWWRDSSPV